MTNIFISYSRKDIGFAQKVVNALAENELDTWVDWQSIPKGEDWEQEIYRGIEEAESFIFLMSPDSAHSEICNQEIGHAIENNKRIIPLVIRDTNPKEFVFENSRKEISRRNWIFCRDQSSELSRAVQEILETVHTDYEWLKYHTKLQNRALEWERHSSDKSLLLRGKELEDAELQLATNTSKEPNPTDLQREYVFKSRQVTDRQRRNTFSIAIAGVIALAALAVFGFIQAGLATERGNTAQTAQANAEMEADQRATAQANAEFESLQRATAQALAEERANIALARQLAAQAQSISTSRNSDQLIAALLNTQSMKMYPTSGVANFLLNDNLAAQPISQMAHTGPVTALEFSPDGKYVVSGSGGDDNTARVWQVATGKEIARMPHDHYISSVTFDPEGKYVVTGGMDNTLHVWDASSGKEVARMIHEGYYIPTLSVDFSPDGKYVASGAANTVSVWDAVSGKEIVRMTINEFLAAITSVSFSPDGRSLAVSDSFNFKVYIFDAITGRELMRIHQDGGVTSVTFSPNGKYVASVTGDTAYNTAYIWELSSGREVARTQHGSLLFSLAFSPDSKYVVSGGGDFIARVWETTTGKEISHMLHDDIVSSVAFSPDGKYVVSGSLDSTARVWETATGTEIARMTHNSSVNDVAFDPNGDNIVSGSGDGVIHVWNVTTSREKARLPHVGNVRDLALSPLGDRIVSVSRDDTIRVWDLSTNTEVSSVSHDDIVLSVTFSPDGKHIASSSVDNTARVWEAETGQEVSRMTHDDTVLSATFSPDGKYVVSASRDNTARVWDASSGNEVARMIHGDGVNSATFSPNGKYVVSGGQDGTVRVWEATSRNEIARMIHDAYVSVVVFDPDGKHVITGGCDQIDSDDNCIEYSTRVWNAVTGMEVARINNDSRVESLAFSPDSKYAASDNGDNTIRIYSIATANELFRISYDFRVFAIAFSPDGKYLASGGCDIRSADFFGCWQGSARVWEVSTGREIARVTYDRDVTSVAFSPDGKSIVSGGCDIQEDLLCDLSTARVWNWQPEDLIANACAVMPRNLTRTEWNQYIGNAMPYQAVCENLPIEPEAITPAP